MDVQSRAQAGRLKQPEGSEPITDLGLMFPAPESPFPRRPMKRAVMISSPGLSTLRGIYQLIRLDGSIGRLLICPE